MSTGKLSVNVFGKSQGNPISDSVIKILKSGSQEVIEQLNTNSSGKSDTLDLETPSLDYSMKPNLPKPYSECDISVEKENFNSITIKGIQIFPDVLSIQNIYLENNSLNSYNIPDHNLYKQYPPKIAEDEIKANPNATGLSVLSQPVIPQYIVVHNGVPTDTSAPNYWIPYKDYIKNVCSSEIYPTWPYESIVANVLAINSFTLNRVYTEWYRNMGYNFTITSSTAYDQSFVYQRNYFSQISEVVDNIFSQYITKPGIEQPLFTQYCDGQQVSCPNWLSQWGSKNLAENGANYSEILKTYYGYDIYFEIANEVEGIPMSYPGYILQNGSTGDAVRNIQQQLSKIRSKYPLIPQVSANGNYDSQTVKAVEIFQSTFNLPQTGITDYATWYEISRIYVAVSNLS